MIQKNAIKINAVSIDIFRFIVLLKECNIQKCFSIQLLISLKIYGLVLQWENSIENFLSGFGQK